MAYLESAISSIEAQGVEQYEVLIADDGSTDGTWEWLQRRKDQNPRIIPILLDGGGPSKARNRCMEMAKGRFIAFLDADDIWYSNKLSHQLEYMELHPEVVMSFTDFRHINPQGKDLGGCFQYWPRFKKHVLNNPSEGYHLLDAAVADIYSENVVGTSTVVIRQKAAEALGGFDEDLPSAEDWDYWLKLACYGQVAFNHQIQMDYLMRPNSETSKSASRLQAVEEIMQRYQKVAVDQDTSVIRLANARLYTALAEYHRTMGIHLKATLYHGRAFFLKPNRRALVSFLADMRSLFVKA